MPRGIPHRPYTLDTHSVHVTLVLFSACWVDVFQRALTACGTDDLFRRAPRTKDDWSAPVQRELFQKLEATALATVTTLAGRHDG